MTRLLIALVVALAFGRADAPPPLERAPGPVTVPTLGHTPTGFGRDLGVTLPLAAGARPTVLRTAATGRDDVHVRALNIDAARREVNVWFELEAREARTVRSLTWSFADGATRTSAVGAITVTPSVAPGSAGLAWRRVTRAPAAGLFLATLVVHEGAEPVHIEALSYAPDEAVAPGLLVRRVAAAEAEKGFPRWTGRLIEALREPWWFGPRDGGAPHARADASAPAFEGTVPRGSALPELADLARRLGDGTGWADPRAIDAVLQPGDALWLAITPAAFASDVRDVAIFGRTHVRVRASDASASSWRAGPGVVRHRKP